MTINTLELIADALRDINVISEADTPDASQGVYGLRKLNQMMAHWRENSIDLGYFEQEDTNDNLPIPDWAELAVTASLSVLLAPKYGASISPELGAIAGSAIPALRRKMMSESLDNTDMSHMPEGSGHHGNRYDIIRDI